jgi:hypothetical protein
MTAHGRVENGVVVVTDGVQLPEGADVVISTAQSPPIPVSPERREALLALIGICKMENPPNDEEVERIIEEERMKKYG